MPLFFVDKSNISEGALLIEGDDARHIARSLRMAVGDSLSVSDGEGVLYSCVLSKIRDELCECEIISKEVSKAESPVDITLYMAYPKSDKLETIIQKAAELGAKRIIPFESSRCIKRPSEDKAKQRLLRLNRIAKEACGQSGRASIATVGDTLSFAKVIEECDNYDLALFCYEGDGTKTLREILKANGSARTVAVVVGSEGGFSPEEAKAARDGGLSMTGLGNRILRCETAPLFALSCISYELEL